MTPATLGPTGEPVAMLEEPTGEAEETPEVIGEAEVAETGAAEVEEETGAAEAMAEVGE